MVDHFAPLSLLDALFDMLDLPLQERDSASSSCPLFGTACGLISS
jgi:hypothetical protein